MDNNEKASEKITKWLLVGISVLFLAVMLPFSSDHRDHRSIAERMEGLCSCSDR